MKLVARVLGVFVVSAAASLASGQVVISQVDGNGGLGIDPYDRDFVELFNRGATPVNLNGWSLQLFGDFGTATTVATPAWDVIPLAGTIMPGQYLLVAPSFQRGSQGASVLTLPLPAPDVMGPVYDGAVLVSESNAVALMSTTTPIAAGQCPGGRPDLVDLFRYGYPNAQCFEGPAPIGPTISGGQRAVIRAGGGCVDGNDSQEDLIINVTPTPRNSDTNAFAPTTVTPGSVLAGVGGGVTVTATRGSSPCNPLPGALTGASVNLSALGLASAQAMVDDGSSGDASAGDGVFTYQFAVGAGQAAGAYVLPVTATSGATSLPVSARVRVLPPAASNDACANAINLSDSSPGGIDIINNGPYATTVNASTATGDGIDAGTCNGDAEVKFSVWYTLTTGAGQTGALHVSELSSEDVVVSLHTSCGGASIQCANREDIGLVLTPGTTYFIQIGRETAASLPPQTPYQLTFEFVPSPTNDVPCGAATIASFPFTATPFAPAYTNDPFNISCDSTLNTDARFGAWYTFTTGPTPSSLEIFERSINGSNFTLFSGAGCGGLSAVQCVDETTAGAIMSGLTPSTTYYLMVSIDSNSLLPTVPYDFTINVIPSPVNDDCAGAINLNMVGLPFAQSVAARAAATDAGAPSTTGSGVNGCSATLTTRNAGVWYTYTTGPSVSGTLRVADFSAQDVFYNVFTGSCGALTPNQCYGAFTADDIFIQLSPNTTYYILVSLQSTTAGTLPTGNYDLTFSLHPAPANDLACNATLVASTLQDVVAGPSATADVDVSCNYTVPAQSTTGYGVWYRFAPATSKLLYARQTGSDVLVYGLFTGPDCNSLSEIGCRMGSNGNLSDNFAYFELTGGTQYWLLVGKIANSQPFGFYNLNIELQEPVGACCSGTNCMLTTQGACTGSFRGAFTTCGDVPNYEENPGAAIPDSTSGTGGTPGMLSRTINVPDAGTISDLKVLVNINHARVGDLIMTIQGPGGGIQDLIRRIDDDTNLTNCPTQGQQGRLTDLGGAYVFTDQTANPYGPTLADSAFYFDFTGLVALPGHYKPTTCNEQIVSLNSVFAGQSIAGNWTLTITDNQSASTGTLNRWGLIINGGINGPCACRGDFNGSGAVTVQDIFDFLAAYFTNSPSADINGVGGVTVQDIFDYLALYFAGC
jgi:subtilisin-like proprotein convertase family protein